MINIKHLLVNHTGPAILTLYPARCPFKVPAGTTTFTPGRAIPIIFHTAILHLMAGQHGKQIANPGKIELVLMDLLLNALNPFNIRFGKPSVS